MAGKAGRGGGTHELQGAHEEECAHDDAHGPQELEQAGQEELRAPGGSEGLAQVGLARGDGSRPVLAEAGIGRLRMTKQGSL